MQLGIVGLSRSGKSTLFEAVTGSQHEMAKKGDLRIGTINVPDSRVDVLTDMYKPRKTIYAQLQFVLPHRTDTGDKAKKGDAGLTPVRTSDALIQVVRNFTESGGERPSPAGDFAALNQELVFADLVVVEKRLERVEADFKRGRKDVADEMALLKKCLALLEAETPLRRDPEIANDPLLKGFTLLSAKPVLVVFNNEDEDPDMPDNGGVCQAEPCMVMRARLEQELAQMSEEDAEAFLEEFGITDPAMDRMIRRSYELLGRISFFTVGDDEVRAWTIREGTLAPDAADVIHSDIKRGFIRAEVVHYDDLMDAGSHAEARKRGTVRLEGRNYVVRDGDIINFRFNV
ncbi:MAG: DUF933 domain-containing protein [Desulfatibacillaceae bacterium]